MNSPRSSFHHLKVVTLQHHSGGKLKCLDALGGHFKDLVLVSLNKRFVSVCDASAGTFLCCFFPLNTEPMPAQSTSLYPVGLVLCVATKHQRPSTSTRNHAPVIISSQPRWKKI